MRKRSLAALAAFVFSCATAAAAMASSDPCQDCWMRFNRCQGSGVQNCDYQLEVCLSKNGCPRPPW